MNSAVVEEEKSESSNVSEEPLRSHIIPLGSPLQGGLHAQLKKTVLLDICGDFEAFPKVYEVHEERLISFAVDRVRQWIVKHGVILRVEVCGRCIIVQRADGVLKTEVHSAIFLVLRAAGGLTTINPTLSTLAGVMLPDVAWWQNRPNPAQRDHPLANNCPVPNVWVEVVKNEGDDRLVAELKIQTLLPLYPNVCFILVVLARSITTALLNRVNANAAATPIGAQPYAAAVQRVHWAPYVRVWSPPNVGGFASGTYFKVVRNVKLQLPLANVDFSFNDIVDLFV